MKNKSTDAEAGNFSNDPQENLRIENEILHLKLKAELGGELMGDHPLPPELENNFLKNILEYEHAFANVQQVKVFDFLDKPAFRKAGELSDEEIENELVSICALLQENNIEVEFSGTYNSRLKYTFITEELFEHFTDDVRIPDLVTHYIYEEFHPNHKLDIESRAIEFITGWFDQRINEYSWELADTFRLSPETSFTKDEVLDKIKRIFDSYDGFYNGTYNISEIQFELQPGKEAGLGYACGDVSYEAVLENGERLPVEGPFKFYLSMEYNWWTIFNFVFPGFTWG